MSNQYDRELVPRRPVLDRWPRSRPGSQGWRSVADLPNRLLLPSARHAIAAALQLGSCPRGSAVLLPAYHCTAMVGPVRWLGHEPRFYPVRADLQIDLPSLERLLAPPVTALVVVHYFGFPQQELAAIDALCRARGVLLIEDCAHALLQGTDATPTFGEHSDYVVASTKKFVPSYDGGLLASTRRNIASSTIAPPLSFEIKALLNILERSARYARLPALLRPVLLAGRGMARLRRPSRPQLPHGGAAPAKGSTDDPPRTSGATPAGSAAADGSQEFEPQWLGVRATRSAALLLDQHDRARGATARRVNYQRLADATGRTTSPLWPQLPPGVVPYVVPIRLHDPVRQFAQLKQRGVPIERFAEDLDAGLAPGTCAVATDYSRAVVQFPCHESLRPDDLDFLLRELRRLDEEQ